MRLIGLTLALGACLAAGAKPAYAGPLDTRAVSCTVNGGGTTNKGNKYLAYSAQSNNYTVTPARTSQPMPAAGSTGSVLFSTTERTLAQLEGQSQGLAAPLYNCPSGTMEYFRGNGSYDSASRSYPTGVQGIGYRVYYYLGNGEELAAPQQFQNTYAAGALVFPMSSSDRGTYRTRIDFVATGAQIKPGTIVASSVYGISSVSAAVSGLPSLYRVGLSSNIVVNAPTCLIKNTASQTLTLGDVTVTDMNSGAGENRIYATDLDVDCGVSSQSSPTVRLTASYPVGGSYPGTLQNQASGGATGLGVRLWLYNPGIANYEMAAFNTTLTGRGTLVSSNPTSLWRYKVGASYLRTGGTVKPGPVTSTATITFTYS